MEQDSHSIHTPRHDVNLPRGHAAAAAEHVFQVYVVPVRRIMVQFTLFSAEQLAAGSAHLELCWQR